MAQLINKLEGGRFPLDGYDPATPYQMVPAGGGTRDVVIATGRAPSLLKFSRQNVALVGNPRDLETGQAVGDADSLRFTNTLELPANRKLIVAIKSIGTGTTFLQGSEPKAEGPSLGFDLLISVKPTLERKFAFLFVSDLARTTVRDQLDPRAILRDVKQIFLQQANIVLTEFGDVAAAIPELHVLADLRDPINLDDELTRARIDFQVTNDFPLLFRNTDFIVYLVWKVRGKHPKEKTVGINVQTEDKLNTVYLGLEATPGERTHTMAHEFGHAMGLPHAMERCLMFPTTATLNNSLLGGHIEQLHTGPIFPGPVRPRS